MKRSHPLQLVLDKEENNQKDIAQRLEKVAAFIRSEKEQLAQLQDYRDDYFNKIQNSQQTWPVEMISRYRNFCYQLDSALQDQQNKINIGDTKLQELRGLLAKQQHKISVLKDLLEQKHIEQLAIENKFIQKEMDEFSSRRSYHR